MRSLAKCSAFGRRRRRADRANTEKGGAVLRGRGGHYKAYWPLSPLSESGSSYLFDSKIPRHPSRAREPVHDAAAHHVAGSHHRTGKARWLGASGRLDGLQADAVAGLPQPGALPWPTAQVAGRVAFEAVACVHLHAGAGAPAPAWRGPRRGRPVGRPGAGRGWAVGATETGEASSSTR